jgi:hypothetical protein
MMPPQSCDSLLTALREATSHLRAALDALLASAQPGTVSRVVTPQQISTLLSELTRAGQWLRTIPEHPDTSIEAALVEYRTQVERLRAFLPAIHSALLQERERLAQQRERVNAAKQWIQASRQTL